MEPAAGKWFGLLCEGGFDVGLFAGIKHLFYLEGAKLLLMGDVRLAKMIKLATLGK